MFWYSNLTFAPEFILERDPWTVSCNPRGTLSLILLTFNWSAKVKVRKSLSNPESNKAWAGWPSILTVTTTGRGTLQLLSFTTAAFCWTAGQVPWGTWMPPSSSVAWLPQRSYQSPPYSRWIPIIPVDSGGIPAEFTSQNFTPATKLCNSGIYSRMVPRVRSPEWHRNPVTRIEIKIPNMETFAFSHEKQ